MRKAYAATSLGQVHYREIASSGEKSSPPLLCLHPAPSSGLYFATVMPMLNQGRRVIAPDYPGYGGSDAIDEPSIEAYASAVGELVDSMGGPVDVLGFHTGCLVGAELKLTNPDAVRRLLLCDVPYFDADTRNKLAAKMAVSMPLTTELDSIAGAWDFDVASRVADVPLDRAFELFAEHLRAGTHEHYGFKAAFGYDCETKFKALSGDIVVLATQSGLHAPTVAAAELIADARFVDVSEVTTAVFEAGAEVISKHISATLAA